ncbi:hypothetical protein [Streptomyces ossamyceticus]|uniref:hypothetical protein n=1 Tax=Streptomyces ossamyceticus TaxID=249581 RepID=UPI003EB86F96
MSRRGPGAAADSPAGGATVGSAMRGVPTGSAATGGAGGATGAGRDGVVTSPLGSATWTGSPAKRLEPSTWTWSGTT